MRRLSTWLLILALVLLALCLMWLLPRLLREEPRPEQNLARDSARSPASSEDAQGPAQESAAPQPGSPTDSTSTGPAPEPRTAAGSEAATEAFPTSGPARGRAPGSIRGRVLDRSGKSVPGVLVLAAHAPDLGAPIAAGETWIGRLPLDVADPKALGAEIPARAVTDALGLFAIDDVEPGRVRLAVRSPRHAPLDRNDLLVGAGEALAAGDLVLERAAWVEGAVFDASDAPVRDLAVVASDPFGGSRLPPLAPVRGIRIATTEVRGRFEAGPLGAGPCRLHVLGGSKLESAVIDVPDAAAAGEFSITLPEDSTISGFVTVRGDRSAELVVRALPAETARLSVPFDVRADRRSVALPRGGGSFTLEGLSAGVLYELRTGAASSRYEDAGPWNPPVFALAGDAGVRLLWTADASVSFALVDAGGSPVRGTCRVSFERTIPAFALVRTDIEGSTGACEIAGLRPLGPRTIDGLFASRGFEALPRAVELRSGETTDLGVLALKPAPRLSVHVVDAATERPIAGARVRAREVSTGLDACGLEPEPVATSAKGEATVPSYIGAGSRVEIEAPGYAPVALAGPFGYGYASPELEVRLLRGATARIRVVSEDGRPIPGLRVEWTAGDWSPPGPRDAPAEPRPIGERPDRRASRVTDPEGRVDFANLAPGRHAFHVERHRARVLDGEWTQRELRDGEDAEIELQSRAPASLEVRLTDAGTSLAGAPVCLVRAEDAARSPDLADLETPLPLGIDARLDARGRATLRDVDAPATDLLAVFVPGQRLRACFPVSIRAGGDAFAADLATSSVTGTVRDASHVPLAGVEVLYADEARERDLRSRARRGSLLGIAGLDAAAEVVALAIERPATTTDADGRFRLVGLPLERSFTLVARAAPGEGAAGGAGSSPPIVLHRGDGPLDVDVVLAGAGAIDVWSRVPREPEPCTLVATSRGVSKSAGSLPRVRRVYPGRAERIDGLAPGDWDLEIASDDRRLRDRMHVEVTAAEVRGVELKLP